LVFNIQQKLRFANAFFFRLPLGLFLVSRSSFSDRPKQLLSDHAALRAVSDILGPVPIKRDAQDSETDTNRADGIKRPWLRLFLGQFNGIDL